MGFTSAFGDQNHRQTKVLSLDQGTDDFQGYMSRLGAVVE